MCFGMGAIDRPRTTNQGSNFSAKETHLSCELSWLTVDTGCTASCVVIYDVGRRDRGVKTLNVLNPTEKRRRTWKLLPSYGVVSVTQNVGMTMVTNNERRPAQTADPPAIHRELAVTFIVSIGHLPACGEPYLRLICERFALCAPWWTF